LSAKYPRESQIKLYRKHSKF